MGITVDEKKKLFYLYTERSCYQMKVNDMGILLHQYYGKRVTMTDMEYLQQYGDVGFSGNPYDAGMNRKFSLDTVPQEYTGSGSGDYRISSISVIGPEGSDGLDLRYESYAVTAGKYEIPGQPSFHGDESQAETLTIVLKDTVMDVRVYLFYSVWEEYDIITRAVKISNDGSEPVWLEKAASMCLDFPYGDWDMVHFHGRHLMERQLERVPLMHGVQSVGSVRGTSSHHHNPFVVICDKTADEDHGECYGLALVYSGNFEIQAETDQQNQTRIIMGVHEQRFRWLLERGSEFNTPETVMCYSSTGFGAMSRRLHKAYRNNLCRGKYTTERRPVLINNWEATYFDFNEEKMLEIAEGAARLGVEMLVLDDGWFGKRDSDCSGLGDWDVNTSKLRGGLKPLVDKVNALGLKFGIWLEPEMISEDSDLYRTHPDWALQIPGRDPNRSRYQLVLDMSRPDVRDYLYEKISVLLDGANVEYIKWDCNRCVSDVYSALLPASRQGEVSHRYVLGLYELLERLHQNYPDVLLEGCSGGGGRFDPAMLYYSPQIWCSDDTDALERIQIQHGTSFGYPVSSVGAHVSAVPNHQTGRQTPLETRAVVAMAGSFGYGLDLNTLDESEKEEVREQIIRYKKYYDLIQHGDYYRLNNPAKEMDYAAWQYVSEDKSETLIHGVQIRPRVNMKQIRFQVKGLDPAKRYRLEREGRTENEMAIYPGDVLMYAGLLVPDMKDDYQAFEFHFKAI